jgi:polar amino acid transport system substrate-binding protein
MTRQCRPRGVIDFSITYFMDGQKLLVKKGSKIKSYKDLAGKKVGTAKGSTSEINIKKAQPNCTVLSFEGYPEAFLALKQGKVAAATTDSVILVGVKAATRTLKNGRSWATSCPRSPTVSACGRTCPTCATL